MPQRMAPQNGYLLPLLFHPVLEAVQRQGGGGTVGPERGVSELGEEEGTGLQKTVLPQTVSEVTGWTLLGCGWESTLHSRKAFHTRSVLRVRNQGEFLGPVLGWEVT